MYRFLLMFNINFECKIPQAKQVFYIKNNLLIMTASNMGIKKVLIN